MKSASRVLFCLAGVAIFISTIARTSAYAALRTWSGGSGTWQDTVVGNFDAAWSNANPDSATFGTAAGTVTLGGNISLENLTISLPAAGGSGYFIGSAAEDNTLNFSGTKTVTVTATGNNTNQDATIRAGITGSPTMNITGRNDSNANSFTLAPEGSVTQTIGSINMLNTLGSNKRLILGGTSNGNVVDTVTWSVTPNQLMLTKAGTGSWTINNNLAFNTGGSRASRLYVEAGTLTLGGTNNFFTHKVGVSSVRASTFTASGTASKLIAKGTFTIGDNREFFRVQNLGTLSPGTGVETLTIQWNANTNATTTNAEFRMQTGSTYEWDVLSNLVGGTDVINIQTGGSNFANLILENNMKLKIIDAGATTVINPSDQLTVFTYETAQPVTRNLGTVLFDTSLLGPGWTVGSLALTDNNLGKIYLTGLSFSPPAPEVAVSGLSVNIPNGSASPNLLDNTDFGTTFVGIPVQHTFRVDNTGTAALTTSGFTVPAGYSITEGLSASIGAGLFDDFTVQLNAVAPGTYSGAISFANNDGDENPFSFSITGKVVAIPEPGSLAMLACGTFSLWFIRKRIPRTG